MFFLLLLFQLPGLFAQEELPEVLSYEEYLAFVKYYHPVAKQAGLEIDKGEAELLKARGGFDPKIEVDYGRKEFKGTEYYDLLNSTFKIPTWYGIDLQAKFLQNQGEFLNPQNFVPAEGLFSAGLSIDIAQGFLINDRMAALRTARTLIGQSIAARDLAINQLIYDASLAYFEWLRVYNEKEIYEEFLETALERFEGIKQNAHLGDIPTIDTVEAKITIQTRALELEQARVRLLKQRLDLSNFLWLENNLPVELKPNVIPERLLLPLKVDNALKITDAIATDLVLEDHPRLRSIEFSIEALRIKRRLMANRLLPQINLEYNLLNTQPDSFINYNTANYTAGILFRMPLFLRKERGELRLADFRLLDATLDQNLIKRQIENRIEAVSQELESYEIQTILAAEMVENFEIMLAGEERMMSFGESSLFLLNTREIRLIEARLKQNDVLIEFLNTKARFFKTLGSTTQID